MKHSIIAFGLIVGIVLITMVLFEDDPVSREDDPLEDEDIPFNYSLPAFSDYDLIMLQLSEYEDRTEIISAYGKGVNQDEMDEYDGYDELDDPIIEGPYAYDEEKVYLIQSDEATGIRGEWDSYEEAMRAQDLNYLQYSVDNLDSWYLYDGGHLQFFMDIDDTFFHVHYLHVGTDRSQDSIESIVENLMLIVRNGMDK